MPPLHSRATRQLVKEKKKIAGPKSLHRGIHYEENIEHATAYLKNAGKARANHRDLLVHHQKINEDLQDVYARTAALHAENATMEERIETSWAQFERIGGRRPPSRKASAESSVLCVQSTAVPYAERLAQVAQQKKELRDRGEWERLTHGEAVDYRQGSALHAAKDKRVRLFQRRQLRRAHLLRRIGDPNPIKETGFYNMNAGTLQVRRDVIRKVEREVAHDSRISAVYERRKGSRRQWDIADGGNVNRPDTNILRYSRESDIGPRRKAGAGRKQQRR